MRHPIILILTLASLYLPGSAALAHPGSGIVVDRKGNVYFIDTGAGVWKIDPAGKLTYIQAPRFHWMAIDIDGRLAQAKLPSFSSGDATISRVENNPALFVSSDFPLAIGPDGSLYYPWARRTDRLQLFRLSPSGNTTAVAVLPPVRSASGEIRWRNGITISPDSSIYYTEDKTIRRITPKGEIVTIADSINLSGCGSVPGVEAGSGPYYRGLAVDSAGTVYVAATGCRSVLKISVDKKVETVLKASGPWSPTAVALSGRDLYVLEYLHTANESRREWVPRVRKVSSDGTVATLATVERR